MATEHPAKDIMKNLDIYNQHDQYQRWRQMTLNELLLEHRILFLDLPIMPNIITEQGTVASVLIKALLYLDNLKRGTEISLYINSPGGSVDDTMAIYDTMHFVSSPIATYCIGKAMSGAALILAAGTKGKRYALSHSSVMIHQLSAGISGQAADIKIQAEEYLKRKAMLNQILSKHTGQPIEKITKDSERDKFMTAEEAKEYGLIDEVLREEDKDKKKEKGKKDNKKENQEK